MPQAAILFVAVAAAAYSGYQQSQQAAYAGKVAESQAEAAENKAKYEENIHRERVRKLLSTQRALLGGSNIDMSVGTPLLVAEDTVGQGELDALAIRYGGDVEAARARSEGRLAKMQGKAAATASYMKAGSSLLSGGYSAYSAGR